MVWYVWCDTCGTCGVVRVVKINLEKLAKLSANLPSFGSTECNIAFITKNNCTCLIDAMISGTMIFRKDKDDFNKILSRS